MRSSEKIELAEVLQFGSIGDLVRYLAERKVEALSYTSFESLAQYFDDRFGLVLFSECDIPSVKEAIEIRNIAVYNRCFISRRFIARTGCTPDLLGSRKQVYIDFIDTIAPKLADSVKVLDESSCAKFHLRTLPLAGHSD